MSRLQAILHERCPRCREGAIFRCSLWRGWLAMNEHCQVCGLKFEREPGYTATYSGPGGKPRAAKWS